MADSTCILSVCLTTYNQARFIEQALDGVLSQKTNFNFEICVGEDGSDDGAAEICRAYRAKSPDKIRLFERSRADVICIEGRPTGRFNFLQTLAACNGRYVALLEGDDYWIAPHKLQTQVELLEQNPELAGCFHAARVWNEMEQRFEENVYRPQDIKSVYTADDLLIRSNFIPTASMVFRRALLNGMPSQFLESLSMDYFLALHLSSQGKLAYIDQPMSVYRRHVGGLWSGMDFAAQFASGIRARLVCYDCIPLDGLGKVLAWFRPHALRLELEIRDGLSWVKTLRCASRGIATSSRRARTQALRALIMLLLFARIARGLLRRYKRLFLDKSEAAGDVREI